MKEIWKLIELLNESAKFDFIFENRYQVNFRKLKIISKEYWFIKWLVENDKIDHWKLSNYIIDNKFFWDKIAELKEYETLIMLLSISDTPIEDLISYLK
jgi:hypothetical protein